MAKLFGKKMKAAAPPEEEESPEELETEEDEDEDDEEEEEVRKPLPKLPKIIPKAKPIPEYREIPVCLSQAQINNIIIENNIMLKQIISEMNT